MKFGKVRVDKAEGLILAHSINLPVGRLKKGHVLQESDLHSVLDAGILELSCAELEPGDIEENEAAEKLADLLVKGTDDLRAEKPFTGRVNIYAENTGTFKADKDLIDLINAVDQSVTIATLEDDVHVEAGRMVATIKIIPFAVERPVMGRVERLLLGNQHPLRVHQSWPYKVALIATELPTLKSSVMDKTAAILAERLNVFGSEILIEQRVAHSAEAVRDAVNELHNDYSLIIIFGASAITDIEDVIPAGIEMAHGQITSFGMPVDPGNLLLTATLNDSVIIGAPGCARSPAENGFDRVLRWVHCGMDVSRMEIARLGVGGLLMEIHDRPQPREGKA